MLYTRIIITAKKDIYCVLLSSTDSRPFHSIHYILQESFALMSALMLLHSKQLPFVSEYKQLVSIAHNLCKNFTKSCSSIRYTILSAQSVTGITSGCLRYRRNNVNAAFFFTKLFDVLKNR